MSMKRLPFLLAMLLVLALTLPTDALATDPIPLVPGEAPEPIPAGAPLIVPAGWFGMARGLTMQAPKFLEFYFTVWDSEDKVVYQCTTADSWKYWLDGLRPITAEESGSLPFNERIGAPQFSKDWLYEIPDGLPAGDYHMQGGVLQTRHAIDLYWYFEGQKSPLRLEPGDVMFFDDWHFTVQ
jgi:hypothetical protein